MMDRIGGLTLRRPITVAFWTAVVLLSANALRGVIASSDVSLPSATSSPYTAVLIETVTAPGRQSRVASITTIAMRSDRSTLSKLGPINKGSRTLHFASGLRVTTNDQTRKMTSSSGQVRRHQDRDASRNCVRTGSGTQGETFAGLESVAGLRAAKLTETTTDRLLTRWLALDYECAAVGLLFDFGDNEISRTDLVSFTPGEPHASLFDIPSDYQEGPPSILAPPGFVKSDFLKKRDEALDRAYFAKRQR